VTEPREIPSPFEMDDKGPKFEKDFRFVVNRDEESPDPKVSSAQEPAVSSSSIDLVSPETPVIVEKVSTPPRGKETGLPTLQPATSVGKTKQPAEQ
jgi:hypothetical protein